MYLLVQSDVNSRPHPRPSSQSVSLLPLSVYVLTSLPSSPFSLHTIAHSLARARTQPLYFQWLPHSLPRNTRSGGTDSLRQRLQCFSAHLRLFGSLPRITVRMNASISCLTSQRSSFFGAPAMPGPTLFFSTLLGNEAKTIARGLQKRDPDLLDRLIEQYQYRLFRYLVYVTGNKERAEDFFQETWTRVLERGHQYAGTSKFEAWLFAITRHLVID